MTTAPTHDHTANRLTEADPDWRRLHAATVRDLAASIGHFARALRRGDPSAVSAFLHRHADLLRGAYRDGHAAGQTHYWRGVSNERAPADDPDTATERTRLAWYAVASVARMAQEAQEAARQSQHQSGTTEAPSALSERPGGILLAGGADAPHDPLDGWAARMAPRVELQAQIGWAGLNDGYTQAGAQDRANPYYYVVWELGPVKTDHCEDCPSVAAKSPYTPPWVTVADDPEANPLNQTPGDGRTACGASCKCDVRYVPASVAETFKVERVWEQFFQSAGWPVRETPIGEFEPTVRDFEARQARVRESVDEVRAVERAGGVRLPQLSGAVDPATGELPWETRGALDDVRAAMAEWDAVRGPDLPEAPRLLERASRALDFGADGPLAVGEGLTFAQRKALQALWDALRALADTGDAEGLAEDLDADAVELGYNPYRDKQGRFAPGPHAARQAEHEAGGHRGGGGSAEHAHVTVEEAHPGMRAHLERKVGRALTDGEVARLAGAHRATGPGARVVLERGGAVILRDGRYEHRTHVLAPSDEDPHVRLLVYTRRAGTDTAAPFEPRSVAAQVRAAQRLHIASIIVKADPFADDSMRLPRLGFDAPLDAHFKAEMPHYRMPSGRAHTLLDLLGTREGAAWWREIHVASRELRGADHLSLGLSFDATPGSPSEQALRATLRADGLGDLEDY